MKKLSFAAVVISIAVTNVTVFAGSYNTETNSVSGVGDGYRTVLITNKDTNDIVYVGFDDAGFNSETKFLLRSNPESGYYTVQVGGNTSESKTYPFFIGSEKELGEYAVSSEHGAVELSKRFEPEYEEESAQYNVGFATEETVNISEMKSVIVRMNDSYLVRPVDTTLTGDGEALVGVELTNVSGEQKNNLSVFVSPIELTGGNN